MLRKSPLKRKRDTPRRNEARVQHQRTKRRRGDRTSDEARHIARVAQLPCCVTGEREIHVHHLLRAPGKRAGRDHRFVVPITPRLHNQGDQAIHMLGNEAAFEVMHGLAPGYLIAVAVELWNESQAL